MAGNLRSRRSAFEQRVRRSSLAIYFETILDVASYFKVYVFIRRIYQLNRHVEDK